MIIVDYISIALVIIILGVLIWHLTFLNRKLKERLEQEKNRFLLYKKKLSELDRLNLTKSDLENLNSLARDFFKERFDLNYSFTYLELSKKFEQEKYDERVDFCNLMSELIYSDKKIDSGEIRKLAILLSEIVENYRGL